MLSEIESDALIAGEADEALQSPIDPTEQFLDSTMELLHDYASAKRTLSVATTLYLDDEFLAAQVVDQNGEPINRAAAKTQNSMTNELRRTRRSTILYAKTNAQSLVWFEGDDDEATARNQKLVDDLYEEKTQELENPETDLEDRVEARIWLDVFDKQFEVSSKAFAIDQQLNEHLNQSPTAIIDLLNYLRTSEYDEHELKPFLVTTANVLYDPCIDSVIDQKIAELDDQTPGFKEIFLDRLASAIDPDEVTQQEALSILEADTIEWLQFIDSTFGVGGIYRILALPTDQWPEGLQQSYNKCFRDFIGDITAAKETIFAPHVEKQSFIVGADALDAIELKEQATAQPKKRRSQNKRSGRTTPKANPSDFISEKPVETAPKLSKLTLCRRQGSRFLIGEQHDIYPEVEDKRIEGLAQLQPTDPMERIMNLVPSAKDYLKKYFSDPNIREDLKKMLASIIETPYGNGASVMIGDYRFTGGGGKDQKLRLWHLNPNQRSGLSVGVVGRKTRIYYVVFTDPEGERNISILDIGNKNKFERYRASLIL